MTTLPAPRRQQAEEVRGQRLDVALRVVGGTGCPFTSMRDRAGEVGSGCDVDTAAGMLLATGYSTFLMWGRVDDEAWTTHTETLARGGVDVILRGISAA